MKRYFGIIVAVLGVSAGIVFAMRKWDAKNAEKPAMRTPVMNRPTSVPRWVRSFVHSERSVRVTPAPSRP